MHSNSAERRGRVWIGVLVGFLLIFQAGANFGAKDRPIKDLTKIVGADDCGECHKAEVAVWRETKHAKSYLLLPRTKETKEIADKMGVKRLKSESACLACHFTSLEQDGKIKPIAGISCESCHSPASEWVKIHGDFGGKKVTREMETSEHKAQRLAKIKATGMIRPSEIYRLAENCYQCHLVANEKLINVGGHKPGIDFELVSWSQGEVRHNFSRSEGKKNDEASPERKRILYLIGQLLDFEYSLRGLASATENAKYSETMARRTKAAMAKLEDIKKLAAIPELSEILSATQSLSLRPNNEALLTEAAEKIATAAQKVAATADGHKLSAMDQLIPKTDKYKGTVVDKPEEGTLGK
jgi:cytochrome c554/c'-like protein